MGCKGCGKHKGKDAADQKLREEMALKIQKALFDFNSTDYDVLVLGCGSLAIFFKTEIGESEMYIKLKPDNGHVNAEGKVFHPTREIVEFRMVLLIPEKGRKALDESNIRELEGNYTDPYGNVYQLNSQ